MNPATSGQATQALVILGQQSLSREDYATLLGGYLAALAQAAKQGRLPELSLFRRAVGLGTLPTVTEDAHLRKLTALALPATTGIRTIVSAKTLFTGYLDKDCMNRGLDVPAFSTPMCLVEVHEMKKGGTFADMFGEFGRTLDDLCLTQDQIVSFVERYFESLGLAGYTMYFLFKKGDEFFVALLDWYAVDNVKMLVGCLADDRVWDAESLNRFVVPQLGASDTQA